MRRRALRSPSRLDERCSIELAGEDIDYRLRRNARRVRALSLLMSPQGELELRVPMATPQRDIEAMLRRNQDWILRARAKAAQREAPLPLRAGNSVSVLGEDWVLQVVEGVTVAVHANGETRSLQIVTDDSSAAALKHILDQWYRHYAEEYFRERLRSLCARLPWPQVEPRLRLRTMKSRWGSCSKTGIRLNTRLIKAPPGCLDMVIVHELCHLREMNHSPAFYALMDQAMPDWRVHSAELDRIGAWLMQD